MAFRELWFAALLASQLADVGAQEQQKPPPPPVVVPDMRTTNPAVLCIGCDQPFDTATHSRALEALMSNPYIAQLRRAMYSQDWLHQFESKAHFDNCDFDSALSYIAALLEQAGTYVTAAEKAKAAGDAAAMKEEAEKAFFALGQALHTVQDFYAHSNYVELKTPKVKRVIDVEVVAVWRAGAQERINELQKEGLVSGTVFWSYPQKCSKGSASHADLAKDTAESESGKATIPHLRNLNRYNVAVFLAREESTLFLADAFKRWPLLKELNGDKVAVEVFVDRRGLSTIAPTSWSLAPIRTLSIPPHVLEILIALLRAALFLLGVSLISYVMLSYEDEEKRVRNWFDSAWMSLYTSQQRLSNRLNSALHQLLNGLVQVYSRVYGPSLLSLRCLMVAISLSAAASLWLVHRAEGVILMHVIELAGSAQKQSGIYSFGVTRTPQSANIILWLALAISFLVAPFVKSPWLRNAAFFGAVSVYIFMLQVLLPRGTGIVELLVGAALLSAVVDLFAIALARRCFKSAAGKASLGETLLLALAGTVSAPAVLLLVAEAADTINVQGLVSDEVTTTLLNLQPTYDSVLTPMLLFNAPALLVFCLSVCVLLAAALGGIVYALLPRAIYAVIKLKLLENRKAAAAVGVFFIGCASPDIGSLLEKVVKAVFA